MSRVGSGVKSLCCLLFLSLKRLWRQSRRCLHSLQLPCFGGLCRVRYWPLPEDLFHADVRHTGGSPGLALLSVPVNGLRRSCTVYRPLTYWWTPLLRTTRKTALHSLGADLCCLKGWGRNKFLKDEEIESSPNCFIIHLTFSKCWSLITNASKIRAVIRFKLRYVSEPEHFSYLSISHSDHSSFSAVGKGSNPALFPLIWISSHARISLLHACSAFVSVKVSVALQHNYNKFTNPAIQLPPELHVCVWWQNTANVSHNLLFRLSINCLGKDWTWFRA